VWIATQPVDFRKGVAGLAALAAQALQIDPYLCVGRDSVAAASREAHLDGSGSACRHIIRCFPAVAAPGPLP
jgi:hypothetical protein